MTCCLCTLRMTWPASHRVAEHEQTNEQREAAAEGRRGEQRSSCRSRRRPLLIVGMPSRNTLSRSCHSSGARRNCRWRLVGCLDLAAGGWLRELTQRASLHEQLTSVVHGVVSSLECVKAVCVCSSASGGPGKRADESDARRARLGMIGWLQEPRRRVAAAKAEQNKFRSPLQLSRSTPSNPSARHSFITSTIKQKGIV